MSNDYRQVIGVDAENVTVLAGGKHTVIVLWTDLRKGVEGKFAGGITAMRAYEDLADKAIRFAEAHGIEHGQKVITDADYDRELRRRQARRARRK